MKWSAYSLHRWLAPVAIVLLHSWWQVAAAAEPKRYNVLMIIIDDYDAALSSVFNPGSLVKTPNMERIARRGTWFSSAYNPAPACCPSRTALLTGIEPSRSGVYFNNQAYRRSKTFISQVETLPKRFKTSGYLTAGYGKVTHNRFIADDAGDYTDGYYKMFGDPRDVLYTEGMLEKHVIPGTLIKVPTSALGRIGMLPDDWDRDDPRKMQQDTQQAARAVALLSAKHDQPFFLACGFWRPHSSWIVPKRFFDLYPKDSLPIPQGYLAGDLDDVPPPGKWLATGRGEHQKIVAASLWNDCLQAYYASISYVDELVGRVLDALDRSEHRENTIVVFFGDNGYHVGEKEHWTKYALWEKTCRVPLAILVPGASPRICDSPVSLVDLYPTLIRLCGLASPLHALDGVDLAPIVEGTTASRGRPVVATYGRQNHSIRDETHRYIRYRNGDEELYDLRSDAHEWKNLAAHPKHEEHKIRLRRWLPKENADDIEIVYSRNDQDGRSSLPVEIFGR